MYVTQSASLDSFPISQNTSLKVLETWLVLWSQGIATWSSVRVPSTKINVNGGLAKWQTRTTNYCAEAIFFSLSCRLWQCSPNHSWGPDCFHLLRHHRHPISSNVHRTHWKHCKQTDLPVPETRGEVLGHSCITCSRTHHNLHYCSNLLCTCSSCNLYYYWALELQRERVLHHGYPHNCWLWWFYPSHVHR